MSTTQDYSKSVIREKMLLHIFLSDIYKWAWRQNNIALEILHSEVDDSGYDVVVSINNQIRFLQLKGLKGEGTTKTFNLNERLADKPGAAIVIINYSDNGDSFNTTYQYCEINREKLTNLRTAKHAKANSQGVKAEREGIKKLPSRFLSNKVDCRTLIDTLFVR